MYFVAMFKCCSMFVLLHLDGYLLFIADWCHICFACHFQTVHPIPVIFISISTKITSPFQWNSGISKLRPGSIIPLQIMHMHHIPHPAHHTMFAPCPELILACSSSFAMPSTRGNPVTGITPPPFAWHTHPHSSLLHWYLNQVTGTRMFRGTIFVSPPWHPLRSAMVTKCFITCSCQHFIKLHKPWLCHPHHDDNI